MLSLLDIKSILQKHKLWANKSLGQNFLIDSDILQKIITAGNLSKNDTVIEIGPGLGSLTQELCKNAGKVIAIEKDSNLIPILKETTKEFKNLTILNQDALKFEINKTNEYKLIANIPYYITSPLINHFLRSEFISNKDPKLPKLIVLLIQKEVAEKICRLKKYKQKHSVLSLNIHLFGEPEIISLVPKESFYPAPKVDSAILKIRIFKEINKDTLSYISTDFFKFIEAGFSNPRKKIHNSLSRGLQIPTEKIIEILKKANIDPNRRSETLEIEEWKRLFHFHAF
ncbi:ribosomal RNA small subunit methyltransferase A [Candidatus Peregrinibacteria bacterium RIFOXYB2_FULL_32_7]|nr:MAG: ribosomal RNA small subunit methyltransferase A [Candidatus Peregrinibacteria bacterium RIFOXYB2_FULL_32_7]